MGSKFRGLLSKEVVDEAKKGLEDKLNKAITDVPVLILTDEESKKIELKNNTIKPFDLELTQTVYTYVALPKKGFQVFKIGFNPDTGDAKVLDFQDADHNIIGISFTTNQQGLKTLFDRKTKGSNFNG